MGKYK